MNLQVQTNPNTSCFQYCPACGKQEMKPGSVKSFVCSHCGFSFYINCASAAMALISDEQDRLLLTIRKNEPASGSYDFPGGFIEPGETLEQGLIREIKEELNLEITDLAYLCSFPNTYPFGRVVYPITDTAFLCNVKTLDGICARNDIAGFEFLERARLTPELFEMHSPRKVLRFYLDAFPKK